VVLFFDTDEAGQAAAVKGIYTCRKNGIEAAVIIPENSKAAPYGSAVSSKDPADILRYQGPEALQKTAKCFINDFDYLVNKGRSLYDGSGTGGSMSEGKARAVAFLFPYLDLLDSEVARDSCIEAAADAFGLRPSVVGDDYRRYASGLSKAEHTAGVKEETHSRLSGGTIRMNNELSLLIVVAVNYVSPQKERLFPKFRADLEISDIEDPNAKEIFIALEECMRYGETGMDELLARISSPELKKIMVEGSTTGEFSVNAERYVADGIKIIKERRLERRGEEIIDKLRLLKKNSSQEMDLETKELLAEKMRIDNELYQLKQGR